MDTMVFDFMSISKHSSFFFKDEMYSKMNIYVPNKYKLSM